MAVIRRDSTVGGDENQGQAPDEQSHSPFKKNKISSSDSANENSPVTLPDEKGQDDAPPQHEDEVLSFPHADLARLEDMVKRPQWVIPVVPKGELEVLLEASIDLSKKGLDDKSEACQRFFRDVLTVSFTRILMDVAVSGWKFEIHRCILGNTHRLVELCVTKLSQDCRLFLDLLAMALNPHCQFHICNGARPCESASSSVQLPEDELFACSPDLRLPKGWLVDLINKFGTLNGFQILHDRFITGSALTVQTISALITPFEQCCEFLTQHTLRKYFIPVIEVVPQILENITNEELKREAKAEVKSDAISMIIQSLKNLASKIPGQEETIRNLEILRLKMILRLLQISFNGKMNALNEINKILSSISSAHQHSEEEWLTAKQMTEWIQQNNIISIILQDSLHQLQYVEKLEKILHFVIREKALTLQDLNNIWAAQAGKHEAIVKNVHGLLAKLAWDFSPEQLDHLFDCFKASWTNASNKQREQLLKLIRRLAEDDKDGVMAHKVLTLLWNLARNDDMPVDTMNLALSAQIKILDYSSKDRDAQKVQWINRFIEELRTNSKWVIPALKQIKEICSLFNEAPPNLSPTHQSPHVFYRHCLIRLLQRNHTLVTLVRENLATYMNTIRLYARDYEDYDPQTIRLGSRYSHIQEVEERLNFLRFLLKDGQFWLCAFSAKQIWNCLAENAVFFSDRDACFTWYSKLMEGESDLDPDITKDFFESQVLQLDPCLLTENGIKCFERFFKIVNSREGKLMVKRRVYMMDDLDLIGLDYLWEVVIKSNDNISNRAIDLLKEIYTNLGPRLQENKVAIHEDFIQTCFDRLKASYDMCVLHSDKGNTGCTRQEAILMVRVLTVLREYISEYDGDYHGERIILPMSRAFCGKHLSLTVRFPNQGRQVDDIDILSYTNDTIGSVRRRILSHINADVAHTKIELFVGGELINSEDDRKLVEQLNLKDKSQIIAKFTQINSNMPSSLASDSSTGSPGICCRNYSNVPNPEMESCLPGVIMSLQPRYISFLWQAADLGSALTMPALRDGARTLMKLMPPDSTTVEKLRAVCSNHSNLRENQIGESLDLLFFGSSASQVLYLTEVIYTLLMPAAAALAEISLDFQFHFLKSGGLHLVLSMLTENNFLPDTDVETRRDAYFNALKIAKLLLTTVAYGCVQAVEEACQPVADGTDPKTPIDQVTHDHALVLQNALQSIPSPTSDSMLRNVSICLAQQISAVASRYIPDIHVVRAIQKIVWASGCGSLELVFRPNEDISETYEMTASTRSNPEVEDEQLCCEALEVMTLCFALIPTALDSLTKEKSWQSFVIDLLLYCPSKPIRQLAQEQFFLMCTRCCMGHKPLLFFIILLFTTLGSVTTERGKYSEEYFTLLRRLLTHAYSCSILVPNADDLLSDEIDWLKRVRDYVKDSGEAGVEDPILEGHLGVTKELLAFQTPEKKCHIGCEKGGANLVKELIDDFIFPASKAYLQYMRSGELPAKQAVPVCGSPATVNAGFELLVALAFGCVSNFNQIVNCLTEMYYLSTTKTTCEALTKWEYLPPVEPRPPKGFVGLINAGATCYMNSVIQQLYMIPLIRNSILAIENLGSNVDDDTFKDEKQDSKRHVYPGDVSGYPLQFEDNSILREEQEYNIGVLKHLQIIFGHLAASQQQCYVPRGFWQQFRLYGEPINLHEQHDALEFFNCLVNTLDEAFKALGRPTVLRNVLGGSFADQKICQGCPHKYEREESFTTLNVDIRNHQNLLDSLEQYIKGDLLEGTNAYHCEKCDKKVDTVKRLLIKKLPTVLAIQLKRFDYDWERECAIKFNDYFEFPRELDMEPYTVAGVTRLEADSLNPLTHLIQQNEQCESVIAGSTKYRLVGVLVHSGQANGGHYYSYIIQRNGNDNERGRWFKFDDRDVTECEMDDDEEMKYQCFGGEYMGEVFDHITKRVSYKRQKKWWNAYILFYERINITDEEDKMATYISEPAITGPHQIMSPTTERSVWKQNMQFLHNQMQYSLEYFQFIKKLLTCNAEYLNPAPGQDHLTPEAEDIAMISIQLAARFLFTTGFRTKKIVRGPANDWYDVLYILLRHSKNVRIWFAHYVLFNAPNRFSEYLLECPSAEVRCAFAKLIVYTAHFSLQDGSSPSPLLSPFATPAPCGQICDNLNLNDHLLTAVLNLLRREVSEHEEHLQQYFDLFVMYASLGLAEKTQLLKLNVPAIFMLVSLNEGTGPPIKYQYADLGKLYSVVSQLIRCCSVSSRMRSSNSGNSPLPNPFGDPNLSQPIMPIQQNVADILFVRTTYVKKIIEDYSNSEETVKLLCFCCWENPQFSSSVLSQLLWQVACSYICDHQPYLDLLLQIILMEDSWQIYRIHDAFKGIPNDGNGLFDIIWRCKNQYPKRVYQCIKCLVTLFDSCPVAYQMLQDNGDLKREWTRIVECLEDELERRTYSWSPHCTYSSWSPPVQSTETSNVLKRSHSARKTLAEGYNLLPKKNYVPEQPNSSGAEHLLNIPQKNDGQQKTCESNEEVSSPLTKDQRHTNK